jgi:acetyl esterase
MMLIKINRQNSALAQTCFAQSEISLEVQQFNRSFLERMAGLPSILDLSPQKIRIRDRVWATKKSSIATDRYITGLSDNQIKLRQFIPDKVKGVYLYIHGGGWISGACDWQDSRLESIAIDGHMVVISVEYRLAPEHPFPSAVDDCEAAALWLIEHAEREFGTSNILLGGGSSGAHLCALTLLRMRDKYSYAQFKGVNLVFGVFDLALTPSMRNWGDREVILSTPIVKKLVDWFLPNQINRYDPHVSPLYADLQKMPPALFTIGTLDPLLDDTLFMYMRWLSAGNEADLVICPGGIHGFITMPTLQSLEAQACILEFLKSHCS